MQFQTLKANPRLGEPAITYIVVVENVSVITPCLPFRGHILKFNVKINDNYLRTSSGDNDIVITSRSMETLDTEYVFNYIKQYLLEVIHMDTPVRDKVLVDLLITGKDQIVVDARNYARMYVEYYLDMTKKDTVTTSVIRIQELDPYSLRTIKNPFFPNVENTWLTNNTLKKHFMDNYSSLL